VIGALEPPEGLEISLEGLNPLHKGIAIVRRLATGLRNNQTVEFSHLMGRLHKRSFVHGGP
jgi:hypothetical protein